MKLSNVPKLFVALVAYFISGISSPGMSHAQACLISREPPLFDSVSDESMTVTVPASAQPHMGGHGQLIYGESTTFLSHLAVFMGDPVAHPHNFQVVMQVNFVDPEIEAMYIHSLQAAPDTIHTAIPEPFDQMSLVADEPGRKLQRRLLNTRIVRGHFEQGGDVIIPGANLDIGRVNYFREFPAGGQRLEKARYLLFGSHRESFLTHLISAPPDFQQILQIATGEMDSPDRLTTQLDKLLEEGLFLNLTDRENDVEARVRPGEILDCKLDTGNGLPQNVKIQVSNELYCEQGELSSVVIEDFNRPQVCAK